MTDFSILPILQKIPLFESLDEALHQDIINAVEMQYYPAGHQLFDQGDQGHQMYIIKSGSVDISRGDETMATLKSGDFFGEMALMGKLPRNAAAKTSEESEIFVLKKDAFDALLFKNPEAAEKIKKTFAERFSDNLL